MPCLDITAQLSFALGQFSVITSVWIPNEIIVLPEYRLWGTLQLRRQGVRSAWSSHNYSWSLTYAQYKEQSPSLFVKGHDAICQQIKYC